jgi:hypothetical protein
LVPSLGLKMQMSLSRSLAHMALGFGSMATVLAAQHIRNAYRRMSAVFSRVHPSKSGAASNEVDDVPDEFRTDAYRVGGP